MDHFSITNIQAKIHVKYVKRKIFACYSCTTVETSLPNVVETDRKISEHLATATLSYFITTDGMDFDNPNDRVELS